MSVPKYEKYKDSGVEWLGEVPEHWETHRLKHLLREIDERAGTASFELLGLSKQRGIVLRSELEQGAAESDDYGKYKRVSAGHLVMNKMQAWNGVFGLSSLDGMISPDYSIFAATAEHLRSFLTELFKTDLLAGVFRVRSRGMGTAFLRLNTSDFLNISIALPPQTEVLAIQAFLDQETAKIDALIEEQRRLIALLKEKRQGVISHSVAKGLNPDAPMKNSGVDRLGLIPETWQVRRISSISTKITNGFVGPTRDIYVDAGVRYLQSLHIKNGRIIADNAYFVSEEWSGQRSKSILAEGDVLIVETGDIGQSAVVTEEFVGSNCHALIIVAPKKDELEGEWLSIVAGSDYGFHTLLSIQTGALHPHLNCGDVKDVLIPLPPLDEQRSILRYLREQRNQFEQLIDEAEHSIDLLQERRTALISAAVTGKIDVRNYSPRETPSHEEVYEPA